MTPKNYVAILRQRAGLLRLVAGAGPGVLAALVGAHVVAGVVPAGTALVTGWLARRAGVADSLGELMVPLATLATVVFTGQFAEALRVPLDIMAQRRVDGRFRAEIRRLVREHGDLEHLEDVDYAADIARASDRGGWRERTAGTAAAGQLTLVGRLFSGTAAAAVVALYSVPLAAGLLAATLALRAIIRRQWMTLSLTYDDRAKDRQRVEYWSDTLSGRETAKELRLFGLGGWLSERRQAQALGWLSEIWPARRRVLRRQYSTFLLAVGSGFAAFYWPGAAVIAGDLTLADLITIVVAAWGIFPLGNMGHEAFDIEYGSGAVRALERLRGRAGSPPGGAVPAGDSPPDVRFAETTFRYPGTGRPVLDRLDLRIAPGEVLAIVGRNGAGKTTLVKLLAALYQPTGGRLTADGTDIAALDPTAWRRRLTAVFQDFVRYPNTLRDNVALGAPEVPVDDAAVLRALDLAGAGDLLDRLPDGLDTILTPEYVGGTDLSGGQWQKIAIGRALYAVEHGRRLLILDEPTANLDVYAEAEFYDRVVAAVSGTTVVLISHRLSTVRRADRIVFLAEGGIVEQGTHAQLIELGGRYSELYQLQAERFRIEEASA